MNIQSETHRKLESQKVITSVLDDHLWQKAKKTKETLDESERGEWKNWLKTQQSEN